LDVETGIRLLIQYFWTDWWELNYLSNIFGHFGGPGGPDETPFRPDGGPDEGFFSWHTIAL
jgi:hypothetical protein